MDRLCAVESIKLGQSTKNRPATKYFQVAGGASIFARRTVTVRHYTPSVWCLSDES